jgi:hypothetical protein
MGVAKTDRDKCELIDGVVGLVEDGSAVGASAGGVAMGLCTLNQVDP